MRPTRRTKTTPFWYSLKQKLTMMKQAITLFALIGSAAAFAPSKQQSSSSALEATPFKDALGAQAPVGRLGMAEGIFEKLLL
jgi:hypothetical protein